MTDQATVAVRGLGAAQLRVLVPEIDEQGAEALLSMVSIPAKLACIVTVLTNLSRSLYYVPAVVPELGQVAREAEQCVHLLLGAKGGTWDTIAHSGASVDDRPSPLHRSIDDFPVYAMLARRAAPSVQHATAFAVVVAAVSGIRRICREKSLPERRFADRIRAGCRDVRRLPMGLLESLPEIAQLETYHQELSHHLLQQKFRLTHGDYLTGLELLLRGVVEQQPPKQRRSIESAGGGEGITQRWRRFDTDLDDPDTPCLQAWCPPVDEAEEAAAVHEGCAPLEIPASVTYLEAEDYSEAAADPDPPPSVMAIKARRQRDYVARGAQHLPHRWERLQPFDCRYLLERVRQLASEEPPDWALDVPPKELAAFVAVSFWLSASPERIVDLRIVETASQFPKHADPETFVYARADHCWCLPVLSPEVKRRAIVQATGQARLLADRLVLPDIAGLDWILNSSCSPEQTKPFARPAAVYATAVRTWLESIDGAPPRRLTLARIEMTLFWTIAEQSADVATAVLAMARLHTDASTQLHYYAPTIGKLRRVYHDAVEAVAKNAQWPLLKGPSVPPEDQLGSERHHAGSALCPTNDAAMELASRLQAAVRSAQSRYPSQTYVIELHNAVAAYVACYLGAATGYRSVCDPLYKLEHFDPITRRAVISDKTGDSQHGVRIAVLPESLCRQLVHYLEHLRALLFHVALLNNATHERLRALLFSLPNAKPLPVLFFLDADARVQAMRPAHLAPRLSAIGIKLPLNANRHYLRTVLREDGATGEEAAQLLGQWQLGQEPHGQFSTIGYDDLEERVAAKLENLLSKAGWRPLRGLAR